MSARSKGTMVLMSTPKGQQGHFHQVWQSGGDEWERILVTYKEALAYGHFSQADLDAFRLEHGDMWFAQEWECKFNSTIDAVFPIEQIQSAIDDNMEVWPE